MSAVNGAVCAAHPSVMAVEVCVRCGSFLCADCVDYEGATASCAACLKVLRARPSRRARVSAVVSALGLLGMVAGFLVKGRPGLTCWAVAGPVGFVGLALSLQELAAITRGTAATQGRNWANVGRAVGLLHALVVVALVALFAWFMLARGGELR